MTTIAYRNGVLAADTQVTENGRAVGSTVKARRAGSVLFAGAGHLTEVQAFLDWVSTGLKGDRPPFDKDGDTQGIVVHDNHILSFTGEKGVDRITADFYAIGSGQGIALGAMLTGATAQEALAAASAIDCYTGGEITVLCAT